jgi:putative membrane protein
VDPLTFLGAAMAGCAAGLLAGIVPGLHVNTVCALAFVAWPALGPVGAVGLAAMAAAHAMASILPATYLGAPGEDSLLSALPAHRLLLDGRGAEAVACALDATLAGCALAVVLLLPYKWLLGEPGRLLAALDAAMAWVLAALLAFLLLRDWRAGPRALAWRAAILALAGALGLLAGRFPVKALLDVPASPLLPLLSGLFGAPPLLEMLRSRPRVPEQQPPERAPAGVRRRVRGGIVAGVLASGATAVLPGMTAAVAASAARAGRRGEQDPRPVLATLSAIAGSQPVWGFAVLAVSLRARSGLAVAVQQAWPVASWSAGAPPPNLEFLLLSALVGSLVGYVASKFFGRAFAACFSRASSRRLPLAALLVLLAVVLLLAGYAGLELFVVSTAVGLLPVATGAGRLQLTGCLLVPVLAHRLGLA